MDNLSIDLNHLEVLAVEGADSENFLQGQLTCDVTTATDTRTLLGAACNNKGRVLCSFLLVRRGPTFLLEMAPGLLAQNKANFDKYIVFSKAETRDASNEYHRLGLMGPQAGERLAKIFDSLPPRPGDATEQDGHLLILRNTAGNGRLLPRYEIWLAPEGREELLARLQQDFAAGSLTVWELQDLRQGIYQMDAAHAGAYTPEPLNYDLSEQVSFSKGCYTGQEIVARMHYRGKAKSRLYPLRLPAGTRIDMEGNPAVSDASGKPAGEIIKLLELEDGSLEGLALLRTELIESQEPLRLEQGSVTLELLTSET